ncbi:aldo/keto reductase (plasmid) [Fusobacteria bacterium ZRK30]|nr:aldo/keto reductase [Fusobacteria bacterium ZRK30]
MFKIKENAIDPKQVPFKVLTSGDKMPAVGLGTFGSDRFTHEEIAEAVKGAIAIGYRHIDCAAVYENETHIGEVFEEIFKSGEVKREDLWINSKLWNDQHENVIESCKKTIADLKCDYLDTYLMHWPFRNYHAPGCDGDARNPDSKPYNHDEFMATWREMEKLVEMGLVRNIGTSSVTIPKMELILRDATIKPSVNEMELHPHFQQEELYNYLVKNNVVPIGFCPIGSPTRPDRDKTEDDTVDIEDPIILAAAKRLGVHPAVVCIKWAVQRGQVPIPFSVRELEYKSNLQSAVSDPLTDEEMEAISKINKNCRLIKGQVFLWEDAKGWEDLWDLDGTITK